MSVRRLAPREMQPPFQFTAENQAWVADQIAKYPPGRQASAVIPALWRAQEQAGGWVPQAAIELIAEMLDMATIRVMEVATFYTMFNLSPVGRYFIQFCGTSPCRLRGAGAIQDVLAARLGPQSHVTPDGNFSWLEVECLGACCNAPMVQINHDYYEDLTPESMNRLLDDLAAGRPVKAGPQSDRRGSEPEGAVETLQEPALYDGSIVGAWRQRFEEERVKAEEKARADAAAKAAQPAAGAAPPKPAAADKPDADKPAADKAAIAEKAAPAPAGDKPATQPPGTTATSQSGAPTSAARVNPDRSGAVNGGRVATPATPGGHGGPSQGEHPRDTTGQSSGAPPLDSEPPTTHAPVGEEPSAADAGPSATGKTPDEPPAPGPGFNPAGQGSGEADRKGVEPGLDHGAPGPKGA